MIRPREHELEVLTVSSQNLYARLSGYFVRLGGQSIELLKALSGNLPLPPSFIQVFELDSNTQDILGIAYSRRCDETPPMIYNPAADRVEVRVRLDGKPALLWFDMTKYQQEILRITLRG